MKIFLATKNYKSLTKIRKVLEERKISFEIISFSNMNRKDLITIMAASKGLSEILVRGGKNHIPSSALNNMGMEELIGYLLRHPLSMKSPIVLQENQILINGSMRDLMRFISNNDEKEQK